LRELVMEESILLKLNEEGLQLQTHSFTYRLRIKPTTATPPLTTIPFVTDASNVAGLGSSAIA
jgi:hypothetical protein